MNLMGLYIESVAIFLALVLGLASLSKFRYRATFETALAGHDILAPKLIGPAAIGLALTEVLAVVCLLVGSFRPLGLMIAGSIFALYAAVVSFNIVRGNQLIDCGCSWGTKTSGNSVLTKYHALRPLILSAIAIAALISSFLPGYGQSPFTVTQFLMIALTSASLLILYGASDRLIENWAFFMGSRL